jgi:rhodanese-related sulfurtransferase
MNDNVASSALSPRQTPKAARTRLLLEGPILTTLLGLSAPNVLNLLAIAGLITIDACGSTLLPMDGRPRRGARRCTAVFDRRLFRNHFGRPAQHRCWSEFVATGKSMGGGSGWVTLAFQPREGTLVNQWAADHANSLAGGVPILALDMYEHSYHLDFGAAAGSYVDAFMTNIDWAPVYERYQMAVHSASEPFAASQDELSGTQILDVRRAGMFEKAKVLISGARWHDPATVDVWARDLPADKEIVVYCVYGHEVGRATALRLRAQGLKARFLRGGMDGWQAAGRPLDPKGTS